MVPLRRFSAIAAACAAVVLGGCAVQVLETGDYAESFARADATRAVFRGLDGDIVLRGMEIESLEIRGTQTSVGATRREARAGLKHAALDAGYGAGEVTLAFVPPFELEGLVDLTLDQVSTLPAGMGATASVEDGDLEVSGLAGSLDLATGSGDIDIDDPGVEHVRAATGSGDVRYAVGLVGFYIECDAPEGAVEIDDALIAAGAVRHTATDGTVVLTYGDTLKRVELSAAAGDIIVSALGDAH